MSDTAIPIVVIARVGAPYGVKGWCHLQSFTAPPDNVLKYSGWHWRASEKATWTVAGQHRAARHSGGFIVQFDGVQDRDAAAALRGRWIGVAQDEIAQTAGDSGPQEEADVFWFQLIGCEVVDRNRQPLGVIEQMLETGAHDVMVVSGSGKSLLIPYTEPYLLFVDLPTRRVEVDWDPDW